MSTKIRSWPYITATEAAAILQVHVNTVRRWAKLGKLKPVAFGVNKTRLYTKQQVKDLARSTK